MDFPAWKTNDQGGIKEICDKWSSIKAEDKESFVSYKIRTKEHQKKLSGSKFKTNKRRYLIHTLWNSLHRVLWMIKMHMVLKQSDKLMEEKSIKGY